MLVHVVQQHHDLLILCTQAFVVLHGQLAARVDQACALPAAKLPLYQLRGQRDGCGDRRAQRQRPEEIGGRQIAHRQLQLHQQLPAMKQACAQQQCPRDQRGDRRKESVEALRPAPAAPRADQDGVETDEARHLRHAGAQIDKPVARQHLIAQVNDRAEQTGQPRQPGQHPEDAAQPPCTAGEKRQQRRQGEPLAQGEPVNPRLHEHHARE